MENGHIKRFVDSAPIRVAMFDREMRYVAASRSWIKTYDLPVDPEGLCYYELLPNVPDHWRDAHRRGLAGETISQTDDEYVLPSGRRRFMDWALSPWRCELDGAIGGIVIFANDIYAQKKTEQRANENEAGLRDLLAGVPVAYQRLDDEGRVLEANRNMAELLGFGSPEELIGLNFFDFCSTAVREAKLLERLKQSSPLKGELTLTRQDGESVTVEIVGRVERDLDGNAIRTHCALFDITERKKIADERARLNILLEQEVEQRTKELAEAVRALRELATHDTLTGLPNRLAADRRLESEFGLFQRTRRPYSILMIDVDDFKSLNDSFGHAAGDEALRRLGAVFKENLRVSDLISRLGGDEFMAVLPDCGLSSAIIAAEKLRAAVSDLSDLPVAVSIGVTAASEEDDVADAVLRRADSHLYEAKKLGRNRIYPERA